MNWKYSIAKWSSNGMVAVFLTNSALFVISFKCISLCHRAADVPKWHNILYWNLCHFDMSVGLSSDSFCCSVSWMPSFIWNFIRNWSEVWNSNEIWQSSMQFSILVIASNNKNYLLTIRALQELGVELLNKKKVHNATQRRWIVE